MGTPLANRVARLREMQRAAREASADAARAGEEAARVAARQRSLPKPRQIPIEGEPLHMPASPGEVPRTPESEGLSPRPFQEPDETLLRVNEIAPEDVPDIYTLLEKLGNEGPDALLPEEVLRLVRAGAELDLAQAGPLPQAQVQAVLRKVFNQGIESLTPEEIAGLRRTIGTPEPVVTADGAATLDDSLENSATPIDTDATDPSNNLTPNRVRRNLVNELAERIRSATGPTDGEPVAGMGRLQKRLESLSPDERQALLEHPALAAGIESERAVRDPAARAAAIANAQARLDALAQMAGVSTAERGADQLRAAAQAREVPQQPRVASAASRAAPADVRAARELVGESLPEGDWNALAEAFNNLDPERKEAVLARLAGGGQWSQGGAASSGKGEAALTARRQGVDPTAARPFVESMLDRSTGAPSFLPNEVARLSRGVNELEDALISLDAAKRSGDAGAIEAARNAVLEFRTNPAISDEQYQAMAAAASESFLRRQQAAAEMRNAIIGTDPTYLAEQERLLANAVLPAPRPGIAPGARTPVVATEEPSRASMPSAMDEAVAENRAREEMLDKRVPGGGLTQGERRSITQFAGLEPGDLPLAFKGDDTLNPLESRAPGSRLTDSDDIAAIEQANELKAAIAQSNVELQLARLQVNLARRAPLSGQSVSSQDLQEAVENLERAQAVHRNLLAQEDRLFPPRLVHNASARGVQMERGRPGRAESRINAAGQQETLDNLVITAVGGRPKAQPTMTRANPDLSPAERAVLNNDAASRLGEQDIIDFLPASPDDEVVELGQDGRRGRMGSTQQQSRVQGAMRDLYGAHNPLALTFEDGGFTHNVYDSAEQAAEDLLRRQTVFKPGTAAWDYAKEKLTNAINDTYGVNSLNETPVPASAMGREAREAELGEIRESQPATGTAARDERAGTAQEPGRVPSMQGSWPEGLMNQRAGEGPTPSQNVAGAKPFVPNAVLDPEVPDPAAFPSRRSSVTSPAAMEAERFPDDTGKPIPGNKPSRRKPAATAEDAKLDASATEIDDISGDPSPAPSRSREEILAEIEQEAQQIYDDEYRANIDSGMDPTEAAAEARASRYKHVAEQTASRIKPIEGDAADAAPTSTGKPKGKRGGRKGKADADPAAPAAATPGEDIPPVSGDPAPASPSSWPDGMGPRQADPAGTSQRWPDGMARSADEVDGPSKGKTPPEPGPQDNKKGWPWKRILAGGAVVGLGTLARLNMGSGGGVIDIPAPPGGVGGGGGGGGGDFYPIPPGGEGAALLDEQAAQEAAIQRALERIRGSRTAGPQSYQTLQNYTIGR